MKLADGLWLLAYGSWRFPSAMAHMPLAISHQPLAMTKFLYYGGRLAQLIGMWLLLVDLFTAGPSGPSPRLFAAGVVVFLVGWALTRLTR
jgi:hypothetical protein